MTAKIIWSKDDIELLRKFYEEDKLPTKEIAKHFNVSTTTVKKQADIEGIKRYNISEVKRKYKINDDYFKTVETHENAYLLGFFCADGYLTGRGFGITLADRDKKLLEAIREEMGSTHPFRYIERHNTWEFRVERRGIAKDLMNLGIERNKSLTIDLSKIVQQANITDELLPYFLLGYFDGDGGIYVCMGANGKTKQYTMSMTGTMETCLYLKSLFNDVGFIKKRRKELDSNNYTYTISGRNLVCNVLDVLYQNKPKFFLDRKYQKYLEAKSPAT